MSDVLNKMSKEENFSQYSISTAQQMMAPEVAQKVLDFGKIQVNLEKEQKFK